jgi:hypothetical protein
MSSPEAVDLRVTPRSRVRFAPDHQSEPTGDNQTNRAPPNWNDKSNDDNLPTGKEPAQMNECH